MIVIGLLLIGVGWAEPTPEERALNFLAKEVPRWSAENKCFSCHNNGDAARALLTAKRLGHAMPEKALADTLLWLNHPENWDKNGGDGPFSDRKLARVQFSAALAEANRAKQIVDRNTLLAAGDALQADQKRDGSWPTDGENRIGTPAGYGPVLTTAVASRTLIQVDPRRYAAAISRAEQWLEKCEAVTVYDAASVLIGVREKPSDQRANCLELLRKSQNKDGGWGPHQRSASEPFDTALVILALRASVNVSEWKDVLKHGRTYLIANQKDDGSWQETTRPAGADSYAQRISTTGWATLALLASKAE